MIRCARFIFCPERTDILLFLMWLFSQWRCPTYDILDTIAHHFLAFATYIYNFQHSKGLHDCIDPSAATA